MSDLREGGKFGQHGDGDPTSARADIKSFHDTSMSDQEIQVLADTCFAEIELAWHKWKEDRRVFEIYKLVLSELGVIVPDREMTARVGNHLLLRLQQRHLEGRSLPQTDLSAITIERLRAHNERIIRTLRDVAQDNESPPAEGLWLSDVERTFEELLRVTESQPYHADMAEAYRRIMVAMPRLS